MPFDNPLADCKSNARARVFLSRMQALKDNKYALSLLWINSYPIVTD
jgi:hypothetical protein